MASEANTPGERLRLLRKKVGYYRAEDLARALGVARSTVSMHERNERNISYKMAKAYGKVLGKKPDFFLEGKQLNQDYVNQLIIAGQTLAPISLPLLSCTDDEQFRSIASGVTPMSEQVFLASPHIVPGGRTFVIEAPDRSMEGMVGVGDHVFIDPDAEYNTGDIVAALASGFVGLIIRKYRVVSFDGDAERVIELVPLNEDYPTVVGKAASSAQIIGRVIGAFRKF